MSGPVRGRRIERRMSKRGLFFDHGSILVSVVAAFVSSLGFARELAWAGPVSAFAFVLLGVVAIRVLLIHDRILPPNSWVGARWRVQKLNVLLLLVGGIAACYQLLMASASATFLQWTAVALGIAQLSIGAVVLLWVGRDFLELLREAGPPRT